MSDRMEHIALRWLAWERKCLAVMHERSPRNMMGSPDVLGITRSRYLIEIEIKRSVSDFRANRTKHHIANREMWIQKQPKQFYFFVPEAISDRCLAGCPEWAGLAKLLPDGYRLHVVKEAPINSSSKRLTLKECIKMFHLMSNQIVSFSGQIDGFKNSFERGHDPYYWSYQI